MKNGENMFEVGREVGLCSPYRFPAIGVVTKRSKTGRITVKVGDIEYRFNKAGKEIGNPHSYVVEATEEFKNKLAFEKLKRRHNELIQKVQRELASLNNKVLPEEIEQLINVLLEEIEQKKTKVC